MSEDTVGGAILSAREHRAFAEHYLRRAEHGVTMRGLADGNAGVLLSLAQAHATLALVAQRDDATA